jgi:UDP-N-acetylglucosamine/UDP-N-acetylgalactosamine diphosphorylase
MDARLRSLADRGVRILDPRQTYVDEHLRPQRVGEGATLHPGTRLLGARTFVGSGAEIGSEGPATLRDAVVGDGARVDGGYLEGAVLMAGARAGFGAHFRPGTILEEHASTAHTVGLKHTILLSFVTLGSLINFCDVLMAGGSSRSDHSEVGSGFIHFNFTPWGRRGDKATPSLVGDATRGVFLRQPRIFLGGAGGLVGPGQVGYGAVTGAGQVVRSAVRENTLSLQPPRPLEIEREVGHLDAVHPRLHRNLVYLGQLHALRVWYRRVRLARLPDDAASDGIRIVTTEALANLDHAIEQRVTRVQGFVQERGEPMPQLAFEDETPCPLPVEVERSYVDHVSWVRSLTDAQVDAGVAWLETIAQRVTGAGSS